jgi:ABC-type branched-subunit amino acid transport system substrate-binding protein
MKLPLSALVAVALVTTACGSTVQIRSDVSQIDPLTGQPTASIQPQQPTTGDAPGALSDPATPSASSGGGAPTSVTPVAGQPGSVTTSEGPVAPIGARGPITGVGFDAKTARLGVEYIDGGDAFLSSAGFSSLSTGDAKGLIEVMIKDLNAKGGVLGRRLVPAYRATDAATGSSNPTTTAQQACTTFTQDQTVFAALVVSPADQCLAAKRVPHSYITTQVADDTSLRTSAPYSRRPLALSFSRLAPVLVERLVARSFLTSTSTVGVLHPDTAVGRRILADLTARLQSKGIKVARSYAYDATSATASAGDVPNAVLPFRSAGVDRVIGTDASTAYFMTAADQQQYRPRYALNSYMNLASVMESVPPKAQLEGSVGVGWLGPNDASGANFDLKPKGFATCQDYIKRSGQNPTGFALIILTTYCDSMRLFLYAAEKGGSFDAASIQRGLAMAGTAFPSALVLRPAFSDTRMDGAGTVRDIAYDTACSCFRYQSTKQQDV